MINFGQNNKWGGCDERGSWQKSPKLINGEVWRVGLEIQDLSILLGDEISTNNVKNLWPPNRQHIVNDNSIENTQPLQSIRIDN